MTIMHGHVRGERPQRTPVEIIVTVPQGSLRGSAEPSDLATFGDGGVGHFYDERNRRIVPQPPRVILQTSTPPRSYGIDRLRDDNAALAITADTHATMWTGEDIDYGTCIDYLV